MSPDWFLDRVVIQEVSEAGHEVEREFIFRCERWLARNKEDGKIERELLETNYLQTVNLKTTAEAAQLEAKKEGTSKPPSRMSLLLLLLLLCCARPDQSGS